MSEPIELTCDHTAGLSELRAEVAELRVKLDAAVALFEFLSPGRAVADVRADLEYHVARCELAGPLGGPAPQRAHGRPALRLVRDGGRR